MIWGNARLPCRNGADGITASPQAAARAGRGGCQWRRGTDAGWPGAAFGNHPAIGIDLQGNAAAHRRNARGGYGLERVFGHTIPSSQGSPARVLPIANGAAGPKKHDWSMLMNASLRPQSTDEFCLLIN